MVADMEVKQLQLYERRLDSCLNARNACVEGSWGWTYWQHCFTILLRKMNQEIANAKGN